MTGENDRRADDEARERVDRLLVAVERLDENVVAQTTEVQMLREEVLLANTKAEILEAQATLDRRRQAKADRRYRTGGAFMLVCLTILVLIGFSNRHYNQILVNCTTPGHECYERGQRTTAEAVGKIVDADGNGIPDSVEIKARLDNQPPPTVPPTTVPPRTTVVQRTQEVSWEVQAAVVMALALLLLLAYVQVRPAWDRWRARRAKQNPELVTTIGIERLEEIRHHDEHHRE